MKKSLVVLVSVLAIIGLAACASNGGGGAPAAAGEGGIVLDNPVLFENGEWNSQLGEVTAVLADGNDGEFEDGVYASRGGAIWRFTFENPVDASAYRRLVIEVRETLAQMAWWAGGQLINYVPEAYQDDSGEMTNHVMFGFWSLGQGSGLSNQRLDLRFGAHEKNDSGSRHSFNRSSISGFSAKVNESGTLSIVRAYFVE